MRSRLLVLACALGIAASALWSQEFRGTLMGRILDAQDAVVPNVKIQLTEVSTGAKYDTVSSTEGLYSVPFLAPGLYRVTAETAGFKRYVREGVRVSTNDRVGLDIKLELGQVIESVTVSDEAPILQTASASTGQVIDSRQIENMPM
ncbi:MAG: carboxypeptidase regulatory-like domain-containing protein, partial [Acidobacteriales bacterium]